MPSWPRTRCYLIEDTRVYTRGLRRNADGECQANAPRWTSHYAYREIERGEGIRHDPGDPTIFGNVWEGMPALDDPRFPTHCACGYEFQPADGRYRDQESLYRRADTGELLHLMDAPPGAMWDCYWLKAVKPYAAKLNADGKVLCVRTPNGHDWIIDGPASNGPGWERTGSAPDVTARPSIITAQGTGREYHGFLTGGWLEAC